MGEINKYRGDKIKERVLAELASGETIASVARKHKIPETTIGTWKKKAMEKDDKFVELRAKRKEEFINNAWDIIEDAQKLMKENLKKALNGDEKIDAGKLSTVIGTMYDKQALASDEPTENVNVKLEDFFR
jgi:transposase-like protein